MRRKAKRILTAMLAAMMILSLSAPVFAAKSGDVKHYTDYCCLGDSVCTGYGIADLDYSNNYSNGRAQAHFGKVAENAFPSMIRDAVGARFNSMTCVGMRLVDALWILGVYEDEYDYAEAYDYHYVHQNSQTRWNAMEYMHDSGEGIERIKQSGLITVYLGSNDLFTYPKNSSTNNGQLDAEFFIGKMAEGYGRFISGYPLLLERIRELNPTAKVLVVSQYNPYANLALNENDKFFALGKLVSTYTDNANGYLKSLCAYYGCRFVDISEVGSMFPELYLDDENFLFRFAIMDTHPSAEGHKYIASQIVKALPAASAELLLPQSGLLSVEFNGKDAGQLVFRRDGLIGWTVRDVTGNYYCYDKATHSVVTRTEEPTEWYYNGGLYTITLEKNDSGSSSILRGSPFAFKSLDLPGLFGFLPRLRMHYLTYDAGAVTCADVKVFADLYKT